ncbi:hypothetical protein M0R45_036630 [Rubus argutus]|uniref:Secreted protein n=1 Tax=Rubus argutus TaxID=59490 RepID=A0AAW1W1S0_RUBAR
MVLTQSNGGCACLIQFIFVAVVIEALMAVMLTLTLPPKVHHLSVEAVKMLTNFLVVNGSRNLCVTMTVRIRYFLKQQNFQLYCINIPIKLSTNGWGKMTGA